MQNNAKRNTIIGYRVISVYISIYIAGIFYLQKQIFDAFVSKLYLMIFAALGGNVCKGICHLF